MIHTELRAVYAGYGRADVLRGVDAVVPRGAITALVGPNGAGKSTLLAVLAGVLRPRGGEVVRAAGARPAFVVQRSAVSDTLPLTVGDAVAMGRWAHRGLWRPLTRHDRAVVREALDRVGVADLAGHQLGRISGGQRQRALIAQGLAQEAELLLLDEPSAGLDREAREQIAHVLDSLRGQATIVHATHFPDEAADADHRLTLDQGRAVFADTDRPGEADEGGVPSAWAGSPRP
ncbi:zinc ABC transporter ATP-binding protein AztA [Nocardiopsis sp. MG754419]|uniref:zinc ABC transporter ATP-binding protein AztA n=1 Tax=Nocardiopsis sp. MG754419 TaxID=2259865 RepID=UPI001BAA5354|nr:zinc ABC transporter ATP-binding protein AztA [Nocardiopsis sp. MG754419]MBR8744285.1 ABC transporter ATP-binding protein [Nocardiopsis sp. MG754419]